MLLWGISTSHCSFLLFSLNHMWLKLLRNFCFTLSRKRTDFLWASSLGVPFSQQSKRCLDGAFWCLMARNIETNNFNSEIIGHFDGSALCKKSYLRKFPAATVRPLWRLFFALAKPIKIQVVEFTRWTHSSIRLDASSRRIRMQASFFLAKTSEMEW